MAFNWRRWTVPRKRQWNSRTQSDHIEMNLKWFIWVTATARRIGKQTATKATVRQRPQITIVHLHIDRWQTTFRFSFSLMAVAAQLQTDATHQSVAFNNCQWHDAAKRAVTQTKPNRPNKTTTTTTAQNYSNDRRPDHHNIKLIPETTPQ